MKMIIVGAGATTFSEHANQDRRPPLSKDDLLRMFMKPTWHMPWIDSNYALFLTHALKLYDNIEALFTDIYELSLPNFIAKDEKIIKLVELASHIIDSPAKKFQNILTFFQGKLLMEIQSCIGTKGEFPIQPREMPICSWHRKIASQLNEGDVVVNFNYDLIMPYALLNEKKLSRKSFLNSYIKEVGIPENLYSDKPVLLITPHGSFTWQQRRALNYFDHSGKFHASETYFEITSRLKDDDLKKMSDAEIEKLNHELNLPYIRVNLNNNYIQDYEVPRVILPLQKKKDVMDAFPHLNEEYSLFLEQLAKADTIYLIGKNFKDSDQDIAMDIKRVCSNCNAKNVVYIDPKSTEAESHEWIVHHNSIFNASSSPKCYSGLSAYIANLN